MSFQGQGLCLVLFLLTLSRAEHSAGLPGHNPMVLAKACLQSPSAFLTASRATQPSCPRIPHSLTPQDCGLPGCSPTPGQRLPFAALLLTLGPAPGVPHLPASTSTSHTCLHQNYFRREHLPCSLLTLFLLPPRPSSLLSTSRAPRPWLPYVKS